MPGQPVDDSAVRSRPRVMHCVVTWRKVTTFHGAFFPRGIGDLRARSQIVPIPPVTRRSDTSAKMK